MEWLNLKTSVLHAPEYIGSDPRARSTWLSVLMWCAQQENGGRVEHAKGWKDRQWQQTCGVTKREVDAAFRLLTWDGDALTVWNYPCEKESIVKALRETGRLAGIKSGQARAKSIHRAVEPNHEANPDHAVEPNLQPNGSTERKGIGKEEEGKGKEDVGKNDPERAAEAAPTSDADWLASLGVNEAYAGLDVPREFAKMRAWCDTNHKQATRRRFVNWLNRCEKPLATARPQSEFSGAF